MPPLTVLPPPVMSRARPISQSAVGRMARGSGENAWNWLRGADFQAAAALSDNPFPGSVMKNKLRSG